MGTTRSGRTTARAAAIDPPASQSTGASRTTFAPITQLPIELLYQIAFSLAAGSGESTEPIQLAQLYPLARCCQGFWAYLRPLLFELDVKRGKYRRETYSSVPKTLSALVWGLRHGHLPTAKLAILAARSMGDLHTYAAASAPYPVGVSWPHLRDSRRAVAVTVDLDALTMAALRGNAEMVELLTEGATAPFLNRSLCHQSRLNLNWAFEWYRPSHKMTALHVAILGQQYDVVKVLLRRYAELDQSTLEWYEPTGLHLAAFTGDVRMARLILDGDSPDSPWVPRARSQFTDPRAYCPDSAWDATVSHWHLDSPPPPPFIFAAQNITARPQWCPDDEEIFAFLASRDPSLPTKGCPLHTTIETPLTHALKWCSPTSSPLARKRLLALIKLGAIDIDHPELACGGSSTFFAKWTTLAADPCKFMGAAWDAALEHNGGTADAKFLAFWEYGLSYGLPEPSSAKWGGVGDGTALQLYLDVVSLFEAKAPGFARLPAIRTWLGDVFGQGASRRKVTYADLEGERDHLV